MHVALWRHVAVHVQHDEDHWHADSQMHACTRPVAPARPSPALPKKASHSVELANSTQLAAAPIAAGDSCVRVVVAQAVSREHRHGRGPLGRAAALSSTGSCSCKIAACMRSLNFACSRCSTPTAPHSPAGACWRGTAGWHRSQTRCAVEGEWHRVSAAMQCGCRPGISIAPQSGRSTGSKHVTHVSIMNIQSNHTISVHRRVLLPAGA